MYFFVYTDGGYILGGWSESGISGNKTQSNWANSPDYWILKIDSLGNKLWDKDFGGINYETLASLEQTLDGGYILAGYSNSGISGDKTEANVGLYDYWIIKTDSLGNKQWDKDYGGTDNDDIYYGILSRCNDGGYLISGTSYSNIGGDKTENNLGAKQTWIVKIDSLGNKQWDKTIFTSAPDENGYAIQTKDGCFAFANYTYAGIGGYKTQPSWNGSSDYWIIKFCDSTQTTNLTQFFLKVDEFTIVPNPSNEYITVSSHYAIAKIELTNGIGEAL
jgi:hypothetical protein